MAQPASDLNLDLLIKMMGMTQSDNDNQALVALRKANSFVSKIDGGWDSLLRGKVTVIADPFAATTPPPMPDVGRSGWTPNTTRTRPQPQAKPQTWQSGWGPTPQRPLSPGPGHRWDDIQQSWVRRASPGTNYIWDDIAGDWRYSPPPPPPQQQQTQGATVKFTKRAGQWILKSDRPLVVSLRVDIKRADGKATSERVGTLIHQDSTGYYYNIEGKTNFQPISALGI